MMLNKEDSEKVQINLIIIKIIISCTLVPSNWSAVKSLREENGKRQMGLSGEIEVFVFVIVTVFVFVFVWGEWHERDRIVR